MKCHMGRAEFGWAALHPHEVPPRAIFHNREGKSKIRSLAPRATLIHPHVAQFKEEKIGGRQVIREADGLHAGGSE